MDMEIIERKYNPLLERDEIGFEIAHDGQATPSFADVRRLVCAKLNSKPELTVVNAVYSSFGSATSRGIARVYKDPSRMKNVEAKRVLDKNFGSREAREAKEAKQAKEEAEQEKGEAGKKPETKKKTRETEKSKGPA